MWVKFILDLSDFVLEEFRGSTGQLEEKRSVREYFVLAASLVVME